MSVRRSAWAALVQKAQAEVELCQRQVHSAWAVVSKAQASWDAAQRMHHEYASRYRDAQAESHRIQDNLSQRQFLAQIQALQAAAAQELNRARGVHRARQQAQTLAELELRKMDKLVQIEADKRDRALRRQDQREMDALGVLRHQLNKSGA